ncbi:hypothetical protein QE152_g22384 [Popillia japonica]|uniref:Uncharacterized protein n=1 Tax=Popillia japonica TaxID=7064 RepID=A0AAW1KIW3_POPJA
MPPVQNVPFIPSIPPPQLPQSPPPPQLPQTMTTQTMPPPPMQAMHSISVPPPTMDLSQQKHPQQVPPRMLYPPDMTMARPRNTFVPLYTPRIPNVWTYQNRPQTVRPTTQNFCQPRPTRATYYPKKQ